MNGTEIGYARVSTAGPDLTPQRVGPLRLGDLDSNICVDHRLAGKNGGISGLRDALAAVRESDAPVGNAPTRLPGRRVTRGTSLTS